MPPGKELTLLLLTEDGRELRSLHLDQPRIRTVVAVGVVLLVALATMLGTWWFFALRSLQVDELQARIVALEAEREGFLELAETLTRVEAEYARLRDLFGPEATGGGSDLWLPPPAAGRRAGPDEAALADPVPDSWPLTEPGYITQNLLEGVSGDHPGIDIAVPADSYVRASGAGRVVEARSDSIYGNVVVVDHGNGYRSRYAHASLLFVEAGQEVRKNEVIALTGSTGRSTAPHLHFEILRDGEAVDPLAMVDPPGS